MRTVKIPENTKCFTYYNANPKGKHTSDCVIRAICTALEQDYEQTVNELKDLWIETGYNMLDPKCYGKYLEKKGWKKNKQPRKDDNTKYRGKEFCKIYQGTCVAHIGGNHIVCIKNGKILDIWDSSNGCIGNYWTKE